MLHALKLFYDDVTYGNVDLKRSFWDSSNTLRAVSHFSVLFSHIDTEKVH